jgi:hypothetical protein
MGTHCMIFLTIDNLVSPSSSLSAGQMRGQTGPPLGNVVIVSSHPCPIEMGHPALADPVDFLAYVSLQP